jgi:hypothetical protein
MSDPGASGRSDLGLARQTFQHAAIVQQQPRLIVKRAAARLVREADNVIDIGRRHISKWQIEARTNTDRIERAIEIQTTELKVQEITVPATRAPASNAIAINPNAALTPFERSMQKTGRMNRVARELT